MIDRQWSVISKSGSAGAAEAEAKRGRRPRRPESARRRIRRLETGGPGRRPRFASASAARGPPVSSGRSS